MSRLIKSDPKGEEPIKVKKTIQPVDKDEPANLEAEAGEVIVGDFDGSGFPASFRIGGKPHSKGGTDLFAPDNSFIYSDDKSMRVTDEDILETFGKKPKKIGYSPAQIAKQYDINEYRKMLADPNSDRMQRETSELMIKNYNHKLGKLALVQESEKGFPDGIPFVAIPYLESMGIDPASLVGNTSPNEPAVPMMRKGGQFKIRIKNLPKAQLGEEKKKDEYQIDPSTLPSAAELLAMTEASNRPVVDPMTLPTAEDIKATLAAEAAANEMIQPGNEPKKTIKKSPGKPSKEFVFNNDFLKSFAEKLGTGDVTGALTPFMKESEGMVGKQSATGKGSYGRVDWTDAEHFPDFRNRNKWYFDQHPEFNPRNPKDVKAFQEAYNQKAVEIVGKPYFTKNPGSKYSVDGKFGEVTFSVPNLEYRPEQPAPAAAASNPFVPVTAEKPNIDVPVASADNPFWTQDLVRMYGAAGDYANLRKYLPWQAGYQTQTADPTFYDPTRELAANSEQSAMAGELMSGYAGAQALSGRMSDIQGRGLQNAANILGRYNNLNVGVANQFEQFNTQLMNQDSLNRANRTTDMYDKTVMANQNFDNARARARENIRESFINAWTNRGQTQALNSVNKQYRVNPRTGFIEFTGVPGRLKASDPTRQLTTVFNRVMSENPVLRDNPKVAYDIALKSMGLETDDEIDVRARRMMPY